MAGFYLTLIGHALRPRRRANVGAAQDVGQRSHGVRVRAAGEASAAEGRYGAVHRKLMEEARAFDSTEIANAQFIARRLADALLERVIARSSIEIVQGASIGFLVAFVGFSVGFILRRNAGAEIDPFGFGAVYFFAGLVLLAFMGFSAAAAGAAAMRNFAGAEENLVRLIERTTGEMRDRLTALRDEMRADLIEDLPRALGAASEARIATLLALRFFDNSPVIGVDGEGHRCHVLGGVLQDAARRRRGRARQLLFAAVAGVVGAIAGGVFIYNSLEPPRVFLAPPDILATLGAAEAARPGIVSIGAVVAAILALTSLFGPLFPLVGASSFPGAVLAAEPARGLANRLQVRAAKATAEPRRVIVERYADALDALERRAAAWAGRHLEGSRAASTGAASPG